MIQDILLLIAGLILLVAGGEFLVRGASSIALRLKISPLVVGLTVVAFGTSAPELFIGIKSALLGSPDITMGNVIGSNICNLALVLGVTALISPVPVQNDSIKIDWPMTMGSSLLLYLLVREGYINAYEGVLFVCILIAYIVFVIMKSRKETQNKQAAVVDSDVPDAPSNSLIKDLAFIAMGTAGLSFGSDWFIQGARSLAIEIGVDERVIGVTIVALGTSLPELATAMVAAFKKETDIAVGNLMGSNIFNILSILGITSIIQQIEVNDVIINSDMIWMLLITFLILPMMLYKKIVGRIEGAILLAVYSYYIYSVIASAI
jgi:cation:H+ antiporter